MNKSETESVRQAALLWCANLIYYQGGGWKRGVENFRYGRGVDPMQRHRDDPVYPLLKDAVRGRVIPQNKAVKAAYKRDGDAPGTPEWNTGPCTYLKNKGIELGYDDPEVREKALMRKMK